MDGLTSHQTPVEVSRCFIMCGGQILNTDHVAAVFSTQAGQCPQCCSCWDIAILLVDQN